jgi:hypothetical protein
MVVRTTLIKLFTTIIALARLAWFKVATAVLLAASGGRRRGRRG